MTSKSKIIFKLKLLPLALLSCYAWTAGAQALGYLPPRLSVDANAGGSATVGQADLMLSFDGDQQHNLYLDPQASYGTDQQWYADLGLGYRWIENDAAIVGWYVFASRTHVEKQAGFWIANPGVEAMGSRWDARVNGYIPVAGRSDEIGIVRFNQSSRLVFSGHTESLVTTYVTGDETQQVGNGVDAKVGYQVFRHVPLKAYLGGYFFNIPNADNVRGGAAGVEYWFDRNVKVFANYTYDNLQHNTVVGGLALSFGGVDAPRADPSLSERLSDPVERYLANLGHGSKIPSDTELTNLQTGRKRVLNAASVDELVSSPPSGTESVPILKDVAYFSQTGSPNNGGVGLTLVNCTFENPCGPTDFSQTGVNTLNSLLPGTDMFFNGGTYKATNGTSALTLLEGQNVWGRSADYTAPAIGAAQSTFNGAFILNGHNILDSIILNNSLGASATAITSTGGRSVLLSNMTIGNSTTPYGVGMALTNAGVRLSSSKANFGQSDTNAVGITMQNSDLEIISSDVAISYPSTGVVQGIIADKGSLLYLNKSALTVTNSTTGLGTLNVITSSNNSLVSVQDSTINGIGANNKFTTVYALNVLDTSIAAVARASKIILTGSSSKILSPGTAGGSSIFEPTVVCTVNGSVIACLS